MIASLVDGLEAGAVLAQQDYTIIRGSLVRYAGASGDFNPIHYRDDIAESVGLPGMLAHGMLTMGVAVQPVVAWLGDRGTVLEYGARFTRPVIVDPADGAIVSVTATLGPVARAGDGATTEARVDITVTVDGLTVLGKARVRVGLRP